MVYVVFDTQTNGIAGVNTVAWPTSTPNVICANGDTSISCGTVNGAATGATKWINAFWSDGTNMYAPAWQGDTQTLNASHVNTSVLTVYGITSNTAGIVTLFFGSTIQTNASATPTADVTGCSGATAGTLTNQIGNFTTLPTGTCTIKLTWAGSLNASPHGWSCPVSDMTTGNLFRVSAYTTTSVTFTGTSVSGDQLVYGPCWGF
jgi:hypothetical protein